MKKSSNNRIDDRIPEKNKNNVFSFLFLIQIIADEKKQIAAVVVHSKIPIFEIIPTKGFAELIAAGSLVKFPTGISYKFPMQIINKNNNRIRIYPYTSIRKAIPFFDWFSRLNIGCFRLVFNL
ncbi:hypothetical protein ACUNWD_14150 [Sunxiuqinia sp. A32]|uniref:hypothetical protein n=1 Tax=Sunxiuqinia sp. A32 TaxID=3461496 RepID=UPI004046092B